MSQTQQQKTKPSKKAKDVIHLTSSDFAKVVRQIKSNPEDVKAQALFKELKSRYGSRQLKQENSKELQKVKQFYGAFLFIIFTLLVILTVSFVSFTAPVGPSNNKIIDTSKDTTIIYDLQR